MDAQWLKKQFEIHPGRTKSELARALDLEPPAISKILNGKRQIKAQEYIGMRRFFGLPADGQRAVDGSKSYVLEPLGGSGGLSDTDNSGQEDWIMPAHILRDRTDAPPEKIRIFRVGENIMEPEFRKGEHVVVDLQDERPSPPGVFIVSDGFGFLIRQCRFLPGSKPPEIEIAALKSHFQPQILKLADIRIIGRVIGKLQWL